MRYTGLLLLCFIIVFQAYRLHGQYSEDDKRGVIFSSAGYSFPYDLSQPANRVQLPDKLVEISGIHLAGTNQMACIQDERGIIYMFDLYKQSIVGEIRFYDDGDFEDIELIGDTAWILKSNGDLYEVRSWQDEETLITEKHETGLSGENDCEGLCCDADNNDLLIACKGFPFNDDRKGRNKKAIYRFDLKKMKLEKEPAYIIDLDEVKYFKKYNTMATLGVELMSRLDESKGDVSFQPSGIAVHPVTGHIYLTGAVGDMLLVLHPEGEILAMIALPADRFRQPEGICFDREGNLYISNEGGSGKADIQKFKPIK